MNKFMFCPPCLHSICIPTKFECFICLESKRNKFMPMSDNLFAATLKNMQRGSGCCKKKRKKVEKFYITKNPPYFFFFYWKSVFRSKYTFMNPIKMVLMLYNDNFWYKLVVFVETRSTDQSRVRSVNSNSSQSKIISEIIQSLWNKLSL